MLDNSLRDISFLLVHPVPILDCLVFRSFPQSSNMVDHHTFGAPRFNRTHSS